VTLRWSACSRMPVRGRRTRSRSSGGTCGSGRCLFEQKNVDGEIVAGQKTGRPARTTPLWAPLRDDLLAWQLRSGRRYGLVFPNYKGEPWSETDWRNWTVRVWGPLREALGVSEPPYGLRHSYASLRIREGASIPELAEELGHR
jgi:integrase